MPAYGEHAITTASFAQIDQEIGAHSFTAAEYAVVRRVIHTTADFEFKQLIQFGGKPIEAAYRALGQGQPGQGGVSFDDLTLGISLPAQLLDRYCTVWMAGAAAEFLVYDSVEGGDDDRQKLKSVLLSLEQNWRQKEHWAGMQAKELLEQNWSAFKALVEAMGDRASVSECCEVINHHRQQDHHSTAIGRQNLEK